MGKTPYSVLEMLRVQNVLKPVGSLPRCHSCACPLLTCGFAFACRRHCLLRSVFIPSTAFSVHLTSAQLSNRPPATDASVLWQWQALGGRGHAHPGQDLLRYSWGAGQGAPSRCSPGWPGPIRFVKRNFKVDRRRPDTELPLLQQQEGKAGN